MPAPPVVFFVFNRPDCTQRVFDEIRRARPPRLYVVADGPRSNHPEDAGRVKEVQALINQGVDWPCAVRTNYAETNLGCGRRFSSGLDWVFAQEPETIVLEDDCLPDPTFFQYCTELLARYRDDSRVGQVCGCTFLGAQLQRNTSYVFSRYGPIWGWASWRRAWRFYDFAMSEWPAARASGFLREVTGSQREAAIRTRIYDNLVGGFIDTWDYQWGFAKMQHGLLSAVPCVNLVENIGFTADSTHAHRGSSGIHRGNMSFPLLHPETVTPDVIFNRQFSEIIAPSLPRRIVSRIKRAAGLA
jgi:hypothetical protein